MRKKRISWNKKHIEGCKIPHLSAEGKGPEEYELATEGTCPGGTMLSRFLK